MWGNGESRIDNESMRELGIARSCRCLATSFVPDVFFFRRHCYSKMLALLLFRPCSSQDYYYPLLVAQDTLEALASFLKRTRAPRPESRPKHVRARVLGAAERGKGSNGQQQITITSRRIVSRPSASHTITFPTPTSRIRRNCELDSCIRF